MKKDKEEKYLTRSMFFWIIGGVTSVGLMIATYVITRTDTLATYFNHSFTEIREDIATMKSDISWIKGNFKKDDK
ncbi:MAG: hypothetical protein K9M15_01590 [Candidatus Marinimicrobia bacterium]|nr:hypothetical protein [Candidatus Neomarinimicrobiota bacterium]